MLRFLQLFSSINFGIRAVEAAEAFETKPLSRAARWYAAVSLCCLLAGASLLVTAAVVDTYSDARPLSERFGFAGIVSLIVCVYSGLCYKDVNTSTAQKMRSEPSPSSPRTIRINKCDRSPH